MKRLIFSITILLVYSCTIENVDSTTGTTTTGTTTGTTTTGTEDHSFHEEASDYVYDAATVIAITLNNTSATVATGKGVTITGQKIKITAPGNYSFAGTLKDGQIIVDDETKGIVRVILKGVDITCSNSSAIYVKNAKKAIIIAEQGTTNKLTDGSTYVYDDATALEPSGTIYSKEDLSISGTGSLNITGNLADGIASKDGLVIKNGQMTIVAKDDGIRGKDYLVIHDGTFKITAAGDGLKASEETDTTLGYLTINGGTFSISSGGDGIQAMFVLTFNDGTIDITKSLEGIQAKTIHMNEGIVRIVSSDDGVNVSDGTDSRSGNRALYLNINGGYLFVNSSADGLDSNGSIIQKGGTVVVYGPTGQGNGSIDYDGTYTISGGTLLAIGGSSMLQAPGTSSTQNSVQITFTGTQTAGNIARIQDESGKEILTVKPLKNYQALVYSAPSIAKGNYSLYLGGTSTGTLKDGVVSGGTYASGTMNASFSISSVLTKLTAK